ncbi:hypothetical protein SAMN05421690_100598 [Nitrosomonas sp. Nm51]|nr:hypothetical protein SAMN05421690_100598 [Nitrosomonas sp. Nm51]
MLKNGVAYVDQGQDYYEKQYRDRVARNLRKRAASLGFDIAPKVVENGIQNIALSTS